MLCYAKKKDSYRLGVELAAGPGPDAAANAAGREGYKREGKRDRMKDRRMDGRMGKDGNIMKIWGGGVGG